jgi:hypothetical protein
MASCPKCDVFSQALKLSTPREYQDIARQLIAAVNQGTFFLVRASCPLQDLFNSTWPGDSLSHDFQCLMCGRLFHLHADTYHGHASWSVGDLRKATGNLPKPN